MLFAARLVCCLLFATTLSDTIADPSSGCPCYGCLPSGTFSLSCDVPGAENGGVVTTRWEEVVSPPKLPVDGSPRLGCVSSQEGVVCATHSGYVAIDQLTGKTLWRYDNMSSPSLPIMDIYGDIIGTDGKTLVKIDVTGKVYDPLKIYNTLAPMYSIQLANDSRFLLTSHVHSELIIYDAGGVCYASFFLRGVVQRWNGSFIPVAQPVIYGRRAYILTEFLPDDGQEQDGLVPGLQRLYAVDLWARMVKRIEVAWYINFEMERPSGRLGRGGRAAEGMENTVLVHNNTVYVSVGPPEASRHGRHSRVSSGDEPYGYLWAIRDNGTDPEVLFKKAAPASSLSIYDVNLGQQQQQPAQQFLDKREHQMPWPTNLHRESSNFYSPPQKKDLAPPTTAAPPTLWSATSQRITGLSTFDGSVERVINLATLLNVSSCRLTSKVMVARSKNGSRERLVFAVAVSDGDREWMKKTANGGRQRITNTTKPYVVAVTVGPTLDDPIKILWKVAARPGTEVVGQIANIQLVPPISTGKVNFKAAKFGNNRGGQGDDVEVFLIAKAVSDTAEYSFAIGHPPSAKRHE